MHAVTLLTLPCMRPSMRSVHIASSAPTCYQLCTSYISCTFSALFKYFKQEDGNAPIPSRYMHVQCSWWHNMLWGITAKFKHCQYVNSYAPFGIKPQNLKMAKVYGKLLWEAYWQWYTWNKCLLLTIIIFKMRGVVIRYYLCSLVCIFWWKHCYQLNHWCYNGFNYYWSVVCSCPLW